MVGDRLFAQLVDIGYETFNALMILNTLGVVLFMYLFKVFILFILATMAFLSGSQCFKTRVSNWCRGVFFNQLISLYMGGYFEFLIAAFLTMFLWDTVRYGEIASIGVSFFSFFIAVIFLPGASIYVICQKHEKLKDEDFKDRWGDLYENMYEKREDRSARFFYFIFMLRRLIFVGMCF